MNLTPLLSPTEVAPNK